MAESTSALAAGPKNWLSRDPHGREYLRKAIHLSGALIIPASMLSYNMTLLVVGLFCVAYFFAEYYRSRHRSGHRARGGSEPGGGLAFIAPVVEACARENELKNCVLTPFYLAFSIFILLLFFPRNAAYAGILAATVGDASSAIVGINLGKHRYMLTKGKSLEGSTAFFIVTLFGSLFFMDLNASVVVAIVATAAEIFSGEYDNITVPLSVGILAKHLTCV